MARCPARTQRKAGRYRGRGQMGRTAAIPLLRAGTDGTKASASPAVPGAESLRLFVANTATAFAQIHLHPDLSPAKGRGGSPLLQQRERRFSVAERIAVPSVGL